MHLRITAAAIAFCMTIPGAHAYSIYVSNEKDNTITVVDSVTLEPVKTVKVGQRPRGITITHDGKYLLVCVSDDDTIEMIDATSFERVGTLPSGPDPELLSLSPDGKTLYVANEDDNLITIVDMASKSVVNEIPVGVEPEGMGISPDGKTLVSTSETTNMHILSTRLHIRLFRMFWLTSVRGLLNSRATTRKSG